MQTEGKSRKLLRIHGDDNVLIVVAPIRPGDRDVIDGHEVVFTRPEKRCASVGCRLAPRRR